MRNLISVAVILHVAFTVAGLQLNGKEVEFGDMIAYKPQCQLGVRYQHYAIYVGDYFPNQSNINTFERLNKKPSCVFSPINMSRDPYVFNILDGYPHENGRNYTKGTETEMMARINETHKKCGLYNALSNNCEHLATYVRYGDKKSIQFNLTGQKLCISKTAKDMLQYMKGVNEGKDNAASSIG